MSSSKIIRGSEAGTLEPYRLRDMEISINQKLETARIKAESMLQKARQEKESIEMEAYNRGIQQGQEQGMKMALKRLEPLFATFENAVAEMEKVRSELCAQHEHDLIDLAMMIAAKIVQHEVAVKPESILDIVRAASKHLTATDEIRLKLNPSDREYLHEMEEILGRKLTDRKIIHVMEDTGISRGGVLIETAFGDIDATIEAQVEHLRSTILPNE